LLFILQYFVLSLSTGCVDKGLGKEDDRPIGAARLDGKN